MNSGLSIFDMNLIIEARHMDPHSILGLHEIDINGKKALCVRAFIPGAKEIYCEDIKNGYKYKLDLAHNSGFFEGAINGRSKWFNYNLCIENYDGHKWSIYDPYSFAPTISEYDIYLFKRGTHYEIYDRLGAHLTEIDGVKGVSFGLWAPNASRVSVIGDFNLWDGRRSCMRNLNKSGIWEIFIPDICELDKYKFEIRDVNGNVFEKSDPYGNFFELRPSSAGLVYDLAGKYKWTDKKWLDNRAKFDPFRSPVNIYEVHLGGWKRVEDDNYRFLSYGELAEQLIPYVKDMGYTHIELMPVTEYPFDGSWGYQVTGFFAPTSRYGNPAEFMYFVDKCHEAGLGIILDWVPAHFPKDAHGLGRFDGTALYEHENPMRGEHPDWGTYIFNYGRNEVRNFLIASALFWIEVFHVDGLRVDAVASMLYLDYGANRKEYIPNKYGGREDYDAVEFIKHLNSIILNRNPNVLMIAEESTSWPGVTRPPETEGLGFVYKWNLGWMNDFLKYMSKDPIDRKYFNNNITFSMMYNYSENYILPFSHDEVVHGKKSLINKMPGDIWQKCANLRLAYLFMFGHPGKKLLFMGGEYGQFREWTEAESLEWFMLGYEQHWQVKDYVKELNHFYLQNDSLWVNDFDYMGFEWINCERADISVVSFIRRGSKAGEMLLFALNFTPVVREDFRIGVTRKGVYQEVLNTDDKAFGGSGVLNIGEIKSQPIAFDNREDSITITLPPLGGVVLKYQGKSAKK